MLKNYLKIAFRNIKKHLGYSLINVAGLAIGMACCILILLFVFDELSYDSPPPVKADEEGYFPAPVAGEWQEL